MALRQIEKHNYHTFLVVCLLLNPIDALLPYSKSVGTEVAKQIWDKDENRSSHLLEDNFSSLHFRFNSISHINGWWCVRMYEGDTSGWLNNYLCTNKDIGLEWNWAREICPTANHNGVMPKKCVWLPEPHDREPHIWADNALCLPLQSKVELVWSWCGPIPQMSCVHLYDPDAPAIFNDNFICWKEN